MRVAMVTGGGRGIGRAIVAAFHKRGIRTVVADIDRATAERTASYFGGYPLHLDVTDATAFARGVEQAEREVGPVDVLVNNAGIMPVGPLEEQPGSMDRRQVDINVHGVIHGFRAVLPSMRARRSGHIVTIASVAGRIGCANAAVYSATKFAVIGLSEAMRYELEDTGVNVSYILPGFVQTELITGAPGPRWPPPAKPEHVAAAVLRAVDTGKVDLYVPRIARLSAVLPALLPRRVYEPLGKAFGLNTMFHGVDPSARKAYRERIAQP